MKNNASNIEFNWIVVVPILHEWIQFGNIFSVRQNIFRRCIRENWRPRKLPRSSNEDTKIEWHQAHRKLKWSNSSNYYFIYCLLWHFSFDQNENNFVWVGYCVVDLWKCHRWHTTKTIVNMTFSIRSIYIYLCCIVCGRLENRFIVLSRVHKVAYETDYQGACCMTIKIIIMNRKCDEDSVSYHNQLVKSMFCTIIE